MNRPGQSACSRCAGSLAPAALPSSAAGSAGTATQSVPGAAQSDIYLLATERSTGQPAPPEALGGQTESAMGERRGRMAIGLSGA